MYIVNIFYIDYILYVFIVVIDLTLTTYRNDGKNTRLFKGFDG